jgi:hypothetical protein
MNQHLIKEIQELKREVQQLKEADDINMDQLNVQNAYYAIKQLDERLTKLEEHVYYRPEPK